MRTVLFGLLMLLLALPARAASYFISPSGVDTNNGLSTGAPWLTPNHAVNCGDTITAAAGTYSSTNFVQNKWGTVTCPLANNVAWLQCITFDTCKISATNGYQGMELDQSFWGVQGWEVTAAGSYGTCFFSQPYSGVEITHIIFANNVANGCDNYGIAVNYDSPTAGVDYIAIVGNIIYNAARLGTEGCGSGISVLEPVQSDTAAGTHIFIAGNVSYSNIDPNPCDGTAPTDGEGIILDGLGVHGYTQQVALLNNITIFNGSEGILNGGYGGPGTAHVYIDYNTSYDNISDPNDTCCNYDVGEISFLAGYNASTLGYNGEASHNLVALPPSSNGGSTNAYGMSIVYGDGSSTADYNWIYGGPGAKNTVVYGSPGFTYGTHNITGTNPNFSNPTAPGAPSCTGKASTADCMSTVIANFVPGASGAAAYGYQAVSNVSITNALFPAWLCSGTVLISGMPANIVTPGCGTTSSTTPNSFTGVLTSGVKI
jgi:hypothetical protein